jgi:glycosyltransferase involved in cell wall biosynthesis
MKISLVVPVFNEEDAIPIFYKTVREFEELKSYEVEIVFINDGSKDATEAIINSIAISDPLVAAFLHSQFRQRACAIRRA